MSREALGTSKKLQCHSKKRTGKGGNKLFENTGYVLGDVEFRFGCRYVTVKLEPSLLKEEVFTKSMSCESTIVA